MDLAAVYKISVIVGFLITILSTASAADELQVSRKLNDTRGPIIFVGHGRKVKLICDLGGVVDASVNSNKPTWSFMQSGRTVYADIEPHCMENDKSSNLKTLNGTDLDCEVSYDKDAGKFTLELDKLREEHQYGDYVCHLGNSTKINTTFSIQEHVTLTRKSENVKVEKSVIITESDVLQVYCNATGLEDWHRVSWLKDGENITKDLQDHAGLFQNFTKANDLSFYGVSTYEHRGNYTCMVTLKETAESMNPSLASSKKLYPVAFSFFVRVHEPFRWRLPSYILVGEVLLVGLFTLFLNWRESRSDEADGDFEDSDDENEDTQKTNDVQKSTNGTNNGK